MNEYWYAKQVSRDTAQPRTTPPQQKALPVPEGKQWSESPAPAETPEAVRSPSDFVVMPGKLVGNFSLGMTREAILKIAPKPQETFPDRLVYKSRKTSNSLVMHVQNNKTVQIDFTSKDFYTGEGIHTGNFRDEQYAPLFNVWVLAGPFPSYKLTLKTGGLTFYSLNGGSSDPNYPAQAVGAIHLGQQPPYEVQMIAGKENDGWVPWDKGLASMKQPAEVKTPRPPMQPLPGAGPGPGEQAEQQTPRGGTPTPKTVPVQPGAAGAPEAWYAFSHDRQQCIVPDMGPAEMMAVYDQTGERYTMEDVTEQGRIVQTTMNYWPDASLLTGRRIIWYRGLARCEQAQRTKQQSQEQRREKYR
jgi:hypothetical protein